jgi:deoxyribodipyrimidine photo-lyase
MQEEQKTALVWFRNDLRVSDNQSLYNATNNHNKVIGLFLLPKHWFSKTALGFKKMERFRAQFILESLNDLKKDLQTLNIPLLVQIDDGTAMKEICKANKISDIYFQHEWTKEERTQEGFIPNEITVHRTYDQFLFHPDDMPIDIYDLPEVFTVFRKICEKKVQVRPMTPNCRILETDNLKHAETKIPTMEDIGFSRFTCHPKSAFPYSGGSKVAKERLSYYLWKTKKLSFYKKTRNGLLGTDYSSKFSPWLANGSLSAKAIYWSVKEYEETVTKNQSTYWLIFELLWRDYFKYVSLKYGNKIFFIGGIKDREYNWTKDNHTFMKWMHGTTAEPFVNANMIELNKTGFMSNRGRQNVASYLAKTLKIDWRWGAAYFETMLVDYDVHSNYGNWMYNAGVGNDPRDRIFNVSLQAERYDGKRKYQSLWLQETLF